MKSLKNKFNKLIMNQLMNFHNHLISQTANIVSNLISKTWVYSSPECTKTLHLIYFYRGMPPDPIQSLLIIGVPNFVFSALTICFRHQSKLNNLDPHPLTEFSICHWYLWAKGS